MQAAEASLAEYAALFPPRELRRLAGRMVDVLDPDGPDPGQARQADRRFLHLRQCRDGSWRLEARLTGTVGARLSAVLTPLAGPQHTLLPAAEDAEDVKSCSGAGPGTWAATPEGQGSVQADGAAAAQTTDSGARVLTDDRSRERGCTTRWTTCAAGCSPRRGCPPPAAPRPR